MSDSVVLPQTMAYPFLIEKGMEEIDKNKIVFVNMDWMKYYKGITEDDNTLGTGGSYPKDQKHEIYNFLEEDGVCLGYTTPWCELNLNKICKNEIKNHPDGHKYIENVLVIFSATNPRVGKGRRVVGFYVGATVFDKGYKSNNRGYNVISKNSFLIEVEKRNIILPRSREYGFGYGQHNVWYATGNDERTINFRNTIIEYVKDMLISSKRQC